MREVLLALVFASATVSLKDAMQRAHDLYDDAQYAEAIAAYDDVLARSDLQSSDRRESLLYQAFSHIALKHEDAARRSFRAVLAQEPTFSLPPYTAPKIRALFEQVRKEVSLKPQILALPPSATREQFSVSFSLSNVRGQRVLLLYRAHGTTAYREAALTGSPVAQAQIPLSAPAAETVEYYAEIRDGISVIATAGTASEPLILKIPVAHVATPVAAQTEASAGTPAYKSWWLWTIVGVVVAGGAATAIYFVTKPAPTIGGLDIKYTVGAR